MIRNFAILLASLMAPALTLSAAEAPAVAPAKTVKAAVPERTVESLEREAAQLQTLLRGELPENQALAQLFPLDLLDDAVIKEQRLRLQTELEAMPADGDEKAAVLRRVLELRLQILSSKPDLRAALVDADTRRLAAQRELEQAEASRVKAEAEAQAAEAAKQKALEAADSARGASEKFFATEMAKVENTRLEQAKLKQQLAEQRVALRSGEVVSTGEEIRTRVQQALPDAEENRALYDQTVVEVVAARRALRDSLDVVNGELNVPRYVLPGDLPTEAALAESRQNLEKSAGGLSADTQELVREVRRLRHDRASAVYERLERLNQSRIDLLSKLPDADREEILGLGEVGWDQLLREIEQLQLQFAWYRYARANLGFVWASMTEDTPRVLLTIWVIVRFALLCGLAVWVGRRRKHWLDRAGSLAVQFSRGAYSRRLSLAALGLIERVFPELLLVTVAMLAPWALGLLTEIAEVVLLLELFLIFAMYRLLLALVYLLISWLSVGGGVFPAHKRALTLRSLQLAGIYALVTLFILVLSERALGRGYLYSVVANIWWLGGIPIAAVLVRWWQSDIADGYLKFRESGSMAGLVRETRNRWYGFFVTVAAVLVLITVAAGRLTARFALGFDQTRKALAFLFRRRLERQAEEQGEQVLPTLDEELLKVLSEEPVQAPELLTKHFPGLSDYVTARKKWVEGGAPVSTLLVGDTGFGKTTWLMAAEKELVAMNVKVHRVTPPDNIPTADALLKWLAPALGIEATDWDAFGEALTERSNEAIMIDDAQRLFSRGGFDPWDALCGVAGASTSRLLWVVAMARFPYDYLTWARNGLTAPFRRVLKLRPWSDDEIAALLRTRMNAAGYTVRYDDLVAESVEGVRQQTQLLRTETEYARLIWDYSDGCPRTALRCWKASLLPAGKKVVSVRLFRRPNVSIVERLSTRERFILAALVWHQTLTADMAASVLRFPESLCEDTLAMLRDSKVICEEKGVYRLESDWLQPVRRLLRRENLIVM